MILDDGIHPALLFGLGSIIIAVIAAFYAYPFFISYPSISGIQIVVLPAVFLVLGIVSLLSASWITVTISKAHHEDVVPGGNDNIRDQRSFPRTRHSCC